MHGAAKVAVGDVVRMKVEDISTTGFRWQVMPYDEKIVKLESTRMQPGAAPGASGIRSFDFLAVGRGATTVEFELVRPWDSPPRPVARGDVAVEVR